MPRWLVGIIIATTLLLAETAFGCTRFFVNDYEDMIVGRTMDWGDKTGPKFWLFPRGIERDGGTFNGIPIVKVNPLKWRSQYGVVGISLYDRGLVEAVNEKGLAGHLLYLNETDYGKRDPNRKGLQAGMWLQYLVDNAANVKEAIALQQEIQLINVRDRGHNAFLHLTLEDKSGDSAVIEYVNGKLMIYHGPEHRVLTNSPTYTKHDRAVNRHRDSYDQYRGDMTSKERFTYASSMFHPKSDLTLEKARLLTQALTRASTEYRTLINLTQSRYYFEYADQDAAIEFSYKDFDFGEDQPIKMLNPESIQDSGDYGDQFVETTALF